MPFSEFLETHYTTFKDAAALLRLLLSDRMLRSNPSPTNNLVRCALRTLQTLPLSDRMLRAIEPITNQQFSKVRTAHPTDSSNKKILLAAGEAAMLRLRFAVEKFDRTHYQPTIRRKLRTDDE